MKDEQSFSPENQPIQDNEQTADDQASQQPQAYGFDEQSDAQSPVEVDNIPATPVFDSEPATTPPSVPITEATPESVEPQSEAAEQTQPVAVQPAEQKVSVFTAPAMESGQPEAPKKSSKKKLFVIGGIIAGLLLLGGGGAAAYNLWYQNPDKVLGDALVNAIRAKSVAYTGVINITAKDTTTDFSNIKIEVDGKTNNTLGQFNASLAFSYDEKDYKLAGGAIVAENGDMYVKIDDVRNQLTSFMETQGASYSDMPEYVTSIIEKVDSKWIRIAAKDLEEYDEEYGETQKCVTDALKKLEGDKAATDELVTLYKDNKFIVVAEKLGSKDGSLGYHVDGDKEKAKSFVTGLNDTKMIKELQKCGDDVGELDGDDIFTDSSSSDVTQRVEVWVDRWSHQLTKVTFEGASSDVDVNMVVEPRFNQNIDVEAPKDFITLKDLQQDIEEAMMSYQSSLYGNYDMDVSSSEFSELEANRTFSGSTEL